MHIWSLESREVGLSVDYHIWLRPKHYWVMHSITQDLETRADYCSDEWMVALLGHA